MNECRSLEFINEFVELMEAAEGGQHEREARFLKMFTNDLLVFGCLEISKVLVEKPNTVVNTIILFSFTFIDLIEASRAIHI